MLPVGNYTVIRNTGTRMKVIARLAVIMKHGKAAVIIEGSKTSGIPVITLNTETVVSK